MKKIGLLAILLVALFTSVNAKAITKDELKASLSKGYDVNGEIAYLPAKYLATAEQYIDNNDLSQNDMNYINNKISEAVWVFRAAGQTKLHSLSQTDLKKISNLFKDINNNTSVKVVFDSNGTPTAIRNLDGTYFALPSFGNPIKYTNDNTLVYGSAAMVLAIFSLSTLVYRKKFNANV